MFNPRFVESKSNLINNEWINFARLHAMYFWRQNILYTRIPGAYCIDLRKTILQANGFSEGWPDEVITSNDLIFTSTLDTAWKAAKSFAVIQHPLHRLLKLPTYMAQNRDACASLWLEKTQLSWQDCTFKDFLMKVRDDQALMVSSHWWCAQEYCLLMRPGAYTKLFQQCQRDDLAWWLGEQGITLIREEEDQSWEPDYSHIPDNSPHKDTPMGALVAETLRDQSRWMECIDPEIVELSQDIYQADYALYAQAK